MNVGRLMLSGLLAGVVEIVLKMIGGGVYLAADFTEETPGLSGRARTRKARH